MTSAGSEDETCINKFVWESFKIFAATVLLQNANHISAKVG